jgi:hypothetical protein
MGTPVRDDALTPKDLRYYAPRKVRDGVNDPLSFQSALRVEEQGEQPPGDSTSDQIAPLPHIFQPQASESEKKNRTGGFVKVVALVGAAAAVGLFVGINLLDAIQGRDEAPPAKAPEIPLAARLQSATTDLQKVSQPILAPLLTASDVSGDMNVALPLGLEIKNYTPGAMVELSGLPAGTVLTTGRAIGPGQWRIAVDDVSKTRITPPAGYVGPMTPTAQVGAGNGQIVAHTPLRLSWRQPPPPPDKVVVLRAPAAEPPPARNAEAMPPPTKTEAPVEPKKIEAPAAPAKTDAAVTPRKIEASEIAALLRRAEDLMATGDLAAARLLLQRVAETKNARAAFELASTYDPAVIKKSANNSIAADPALAQFWYERARDWGSPDAASPLEALASRATAK